MTAGNVLAPPERGRPIRTGTRTVWRVELVKLAAQARVRLALGLCLVGPFAFAGVLRLSNSVPADTLFGRWVHESSSAVPLVVLGFAGSWALPLLVSLVAGDVLSAEDHHGTWKTILTRSAGRGSMFAGKALAAATYTVLTLATLCLAAVAAGAASGGTRRLLGLTGVSIGDGRATLLVLIAWSSVLPAVLAFGAVGLLASAASRNSLAGIAVPVVFGLLTQLLSLVDGAQVLLDLLPGSSFLAWHGLFAEPQFRWPLVRGIVVSAGWIVAAVGVAWVLIRRRDVTGG